MGFGTGRWREKIPLGRTAGNGRKTLKIAEILPKKWRATGKLRQQQRRLESLTRTSLLPSEHALGLNSRVPQDPGSPLWKL